MELLLNLLWLMLPVPAFWLWQRQCQRIRRGCHPFRGVLVLGCLLILLFPVISASDDLHFIRPEMEESSSSKRALRQCASDKVSNLTISPPTLAAISRIPQIVLVARDCGLAFIPGVSLLRSAPLHSHAQRGPPSAILA